MSLSPIRQGNTGANHAPQLVDDSGNSLVSTLSAGLTTAISVTFVRTDVQPATTRTGAGSWYVDSPTSGACHYVYNAADVAAAGIYDCFVTITLAGGLVTLDPYQLVIKPPPGL